MGEKDEVIIAKIVSMSDGKKGVAWAKLREALAKDGVTKEELDEAMLRLMDDGVLEEPVIGRIRKREEVQEVVYTPSVEPRSICSCGHTGDGMGSQHDADPVTGNAGLGPCQMPGCPCVGFQFDHFTEKYATKSGKPTPASKKSTDEVVKKLVRSKRKKDLEAQETAAAPAPTQTPGPVPSAQPAPQEAPHTCENCQGEGSDCHSYCDGQDHWQPRVEVATPMAVSALGSSPVPDSDIHTPAQTDASAQIHLLRADEVKSNLPQGMKVEKVVFSAPEPGVLAADTTLAVDPKVFKGDPVAAAKKLLADAGFTIGTLKHKAYQVIEMHKDKEHIERGLCIRLDNTRSLTIIIHKKKGAKALIAFPPTELALSIKDATRYARGCLKATDMAEEMEEELGG